MSSRWSTGDRRPHGAGGMRGPRRPSASELGVPPRIARSPCPLRRSRGTARRIPDPLPRRDFHRERQRPEQRIVRRGQDGAVPRCGPSTMRIGIRPYLGDHVAARPGWWQIGDRAVQDRVRVFGSACDSVVAVEQLRAGNAIDVEKNQELGGISYRRGRSHVASHRHRQRAGGLALNHQRRRLQLAYQGGDGGVTERHHDVQVRPQCAGGEAFELPPQVVAPAVHDGDDGGAHYVPCLQRRAVDSMASAARSAAPSTSHRRHRRGSVAMVAVSSAGHARGSGMPCVTTASWWRWSIRAVACCSSKAATAGGSKRDVSPRRHQQCSSDPRG